MNRRASPVPPWIPEDLPAAPGIYQFEATCGTVLYVGKSVNLRRRVRGWFYGGGPKTPRLAEMMALARAVEIVPTGSDLEARIEEAERIVTGRPCYNRILRNCASGWYLEIDWSDPFPRLRTVRTPRRARAQYFGPYRGRALPAGAARLLERIFRLRSCAGRIVPDAARSPCLAYGLDLCTAPCVAEAGVTAYRGQVERAARLVADPHCALALKAELAAVRDRASAACHYEKASRVQRRLDWLAEFEAQRSALETPWSSRSWLIALPHASPDQGVVIPVSRGRVLPRQTIRWGEAGWREAVGDAVYKTRVAELVMPAVLDPAEMVLCHIVTEWLADGARGGLALDLDRLDEAAIAARLARFSRAGGWKPVRSPPDSGVGRSSAGCNGGTRRPRARSLRPR